MTPEQKAAYVIGEAVCAYIKCESMKAANQSRADRGLAQAYNEQAFLDLINEHPIYHNATIGLFDD